jgi:predicted RNA binding protein YcfA (HicA-like mRNA interferase family)
MSALNAKETIQNLTKKGFKPGIKKDHRCFEFWHENIFITRTFTSHNNQDIDDYLISQMSKQCKVSSSFFKEFAKCNKSKEEYVIELINGGFIEPLASKEENTKK